MQQLTRVALSDYNTFTFAELLIETKKMPAKIKTKLRSILYESAGKYALNKGITKRFMNLGYNGSPLDLLPEDKNEQLNFQLYNVITSGVDLKGKSVLEIGCGRGGGCYFLITYKYASRVTGIDLSESNINLAKKLAGNEHTTFFTQGAENIALPPNSFDCIVNIESSHCYENKRAFLKNVFNLLKPSGLFIYADTFNAANFSRIKENLTGFGFTVKKEEDITKGVLESLQQRPEEHVSFFKRHVVSLLLPSFYGYGESTIYNELKQGRKKYFSFICLKQKVDNA